MPTPQLDKTLEELLKEFEEYECTGIHCNHETSDKHYLINEDLLNQVYNLGVTTVKLAEKQ